MTEVEDRAENFLDRLVEIRGGSRRPEQIRLSRGMARYQESGRTLLAEAPTGSGKSYAAIACARATGEKCLISTHTHALQQQLQHDAEMLSAATGEFTVSVLKGKTAYVCKHKEAQYRGELKTSGGYESLPEEEKDLLDWAEETITGERSELDFPVSNDAWFRIAASSEECTGPAHKQCFAEQAKARAMQSDIVILNHALVAQGMNQENFLGGLFPNLIVDECHEFPSVVGDAFGANITSPKLLSLIKKCNRLDPEGAKEARGVVENIVSQGRGVKEPLRPLNGHKIMNEVSFLLSKFLHWNTIIGESEASRDQTLRSALFAISGELEIFLRGDTDFETSWVQWWDDGFTLRSVLFNTGPTIKMQLLDVYHSVEFISATIRVAGSFQNTAQRLGLRRDNFTGATIPHVFDYENNGLIWLPERLKQPNDPQFPTQVAMVSKNVIQSANGRTLILCSSWKNVNAISEILNEKIGEDYTILTQKPGENLKTLATRFREDQHSVLVGTRTLWTGMSFEGDTCLCVVIDKMPFPSPSDPVIAARSEYAEKNDVSSFATVSLPEAIRTIMQGAGRLIRTTQDHGVLVLCDARLNEKSPHGKQYANRVLSSLPPMPVTYGTKDALDRIKKFGEEADSK